MRRRIGMAMPYQYPGYKFAGRDGIRFYAEEIWDRNPLFRNIEYASKTRVDGPVILPMRIFKDVSIYAR